MADEPTRAGVRATYETIAEHFAKTRAYAWPEIERFVDEAACGDGATALDLGCGNGRHAELLAERAARVVALDASRGLLGVARERLEALSAARLVQGDAAALPLGSATVDLAVYVATLHHLPTERARRRSLAELARVLAPGSEALVSVWSTTHDRFDVPADAETGFDTTVDWTLPDDQVVERFYHIYAPPEFRAAVESSPLALVDFEVSSGNCYAVVRPEG